MKKLLLLGATILVALSLSIAQEPPHPGGGNPPGSGDPPVGGGAPIDGGVTMLMLLGLSYGAKKVYNLKLNKIKK